MSHYTPAPKRKRDDDSDTENYLQKLAAEIDEDDYVPVKERRARMLQRQSGRVEIRREDKQEAPPPTTTTDAPHRAGTSLLRANAAAKQSNPEETQREREEKEEKDLMQSFMKKQALRSVQENATGIIYNEPMRTGWVPPSWIAKRSEEGNQRIRDRLRIVTIGDHIPPPITAFTAMRFPRAIICALNADGISKPTPIQTQALPAILSGRDCVGISYTGSGKTLVFVLPMIMLALQSVDSRNASENALVYLEEWRMPLEQNEGPLAIVICPSRELARQTHHIVERYCAALARSGWPEVHSLLCVGGEDIRSSAETLRRGIHIAVCTPGRLKDFLGKKKINLDICKYLCLDEADRMVWPHFSCSDTIC